MGEKKKGWKKIKINPYQVLQMGLVELVVLNEASLQQ